MKKNAILLIFITFLITSCGILFTNRNYWAHNIYLDGYWGEWKHFPLSQPSMQGSYEDFVVYREYDHPSNFVLKVKVNGGSIQKDIDMSLASKDAANWILRDGEVTFFVPPKYSSKEDASHWMAVNFEYLQRGTYKVTYPAQIRVTIMKHEYCYNINFNGIAIGLSIPR